MNSTVCLRLLRFFLGFAAVAWGVSFFGIFLSWDNAEEALRGLGAGPIPHDPLLDYWLRMASGAFGLVGCLYLRLCLQPVRHAVVIPWFGWLMVVEGLILLAHGLRLGLRPFPFYADTAACLIGGCGILICSRGLTMPATRRKQGQRIKGDPAGQQGDRSDRGI